ncbi:MAG: dicarboxylate/amino acid:cation symporter [Brumimicrobium sp.]|nr:dicarboxylate/amino acid:cation symporter [Brumimicrobium sp.]
MNQEQKKKKRLALHWKIIIGMILGVVFSLVLLQTPWGKDTTIIKVKGVDTSISNASLFVKHWIKPFGNMFINALKLIAVPLILGSLIKGVSDLKDVSKLSKMGLKTISIFIATTVTAVCIGIAVVNIIQPGKTISEETRISLMDSFSGEASHNISNAELQKENGPLKAIEDLIPNNIFFSASDNANMLQVIVFALLFGIAMIMIPEEKARPVKQFFDSFNDVILKLIDVIMLAAPIGVFALLAGLVVEAPSPDLFMALLWYAISVIIGLTLMLGVYGFMVYAFAKKSPKFFFKGIFPAQLLAFSTSSSAATLPVTMDRVENHLGVDEEISSFVLPIGATINMDGTSLYQAVAAIFIAQAMGMDLSAMTQIGIIATATLASIGSAAVPGAGMVMLVIVLAQAGIPEAGLALIFAIDRPLDMLRTTINVTGDATVSMVVAKGENMLKK